MAKMMKLYRIDIDTAKTLNIAHFNPTCKAILKAMYRIEKSADSEQFKGSTGEDILKYAVQTGLWFTRQDPSKYHTTWAYYVKKLKNEAGIYESSSVRGPSTEEFLEDDEEFLDEPNNIDGEMTMGDLMDNPNEENPVDSEDEAARAEEELAAKLEDAELERMIAEEAQLQAAE